MNRILCGRPLRRVFTGAALAWSLAGCVVAPPRAYPPPPVQPPPQQTVYFYPELSQDEAKQDRDRYECYRWAVRETGVDPGMTPVRGVPPPPRAAVRDGAEVVAGAATGAIVGAAVSSPHNTGQGMVLGAIFGTMIGAAAHEARVQSAEQTYARHVAAQQVPVDNFRRAMGACMTGRGYRVG
jgi:glycine zipper 2TM protein